VRERGGKGQGWKVRTINILQAIEAPSLLFLYFKPPFTWGLKGGLGIEGGSDPKCYISGGYSIREIQVGCEEKLGKEKIGGNSFLN